MSNESIGKLVLLISVIVIICVIIAVIVRNYQYKKLVNEVLQYLNLQGWNFTNQRDEFISVKSSKGVDNYTYIKYFKDERAKDI